MLTRNRKWILLITPAAAIKVFSLFPDAVERYYSNGLYPFIAGLLRTLLGWIPISVGDVLYGIVILWFLIKFISFFRKLLDGRVSRPYLRYITRRCVAYLLIVYIAFNFLWGLNYNRRGIMYQLTLKSEPYSTQDLRSVLTVIAERLNDLDSLAHINRSSLKSKKYLFAQSVRAYQDLAALDNTFTYHHSSVKPSIFSYLGNYLGFSGYYNPFSGEAQVNTRVPLYIRPFTTCHEIGHQLGYAKEDEANFAGYLSGKSSGDPLFRYSVYFDLYLYAAGQLYVRDSTLLVPIRESLRPGIRNDYKDLRQFYTKYQNPFEPVIRHLYGRYLKANEQPQGMMSYDEVTGRLVAYYRKYGKSAL